MKKIFVGLFTIALLTACSNNDENNNTKAQKNQKEQVVNVYTHRHYEPDQQIFKMFEEQTGIKVKVINASADELIQKMKMEGKHSPADVLITVDAGRLSRAKDQGLLQSIHSVILEKAIPKHLQDVDNRSEERRVGKECRYWREKKHYKKKE